MGGGVALALFLVSVVCVIQMKRGTPRVASSRRPGSLPCSCLKGNLAAILRLLGPASEGLLTSFQEKWRPCKFLHLILDLRPPSWCIYKNLALVGLYSGDLGGEHL